MLQIDMLACKLLEHDVLALHKLQQFFVKHERLLLVPKRFAQDVADVVFVRVDLAGLLCGLRSAGVAAPVAPPPAVACDSHRLCRYRRNFKTAVHGSPGLAATGLYTSGILANRTVSAAV